MQRPNVGVGVALVKDGRILLGLRNPDSSKADSELHGEGTWTALGGKLEFGESLLDCARREVAEECGMRLKGAKTVSVSEEFSGDAHFITIGMLAEQFEGEPKVMEPDIIEWRWWPLDGLPENLFIPTKNMIDNWRAGRIHSGELSGKKK